MSRLADKLTGGEFVLTAEIAPPKGVATAAALTRLERLKGFDAINVTDNQGACMRMAALALARILVEQGYEPILQMTCRDRNRMALQSDLLGAAALGVENLLLLTGDHPRFGDHVAARPVFDLDSVHLLQAVQALMQGRDLAGNHLASYPTFCAGAAVAPAAEPRDVVLAKVAKKIRCGARFFQTQAVFERSRIASFMADLGADRIPVILGVVLLTGPRMAHFLNSHIPGVQVPQDLLKRLEEADKPLVEGVRIARETVGWAREFCQGVHLMTFGHEQLIPQILGEEPIRSDA